MRDSFYMAWQYLRRHCGTTSMLVAAITLMLFLPAALLLIVDDATEHFRARAADTPLLVGARGSPLELVLGSLYFDELQPNIMRMTQLDRVNEMKLGRSIPLNVAYRTRNTAIVGTTRDYFKLRRLQLSSGRWLEILGECVVGSKAAKRLQVDVGSKIPVSSQQVFALRDAPLRLSVVGILSPTETADDEVLFVELKTAWLIAGFGHGHLSNAKHGTAAAKEYTDITVENAGSFHFHTDASKLPVTAIIVQPESDKAATLLLGEFLSPDDSAQIVRPSKVMDDLLARIVMVRSYILSAVAIVSVVTVGVMGLVVMLSIRLRQRELSTMTKIGCSQFAIVSILGSQLAIIIALAVLAATLLTLIVSAFGQEIVRGLMV